MTLLNSYLDPLNLRRLWWIRFQPMSYHCIIIMSFFQWLLITRICHNSVPFYRIPIISTRKQIMEILQFQVTSTIHWISRLSSLLQFKSLTHNHSSKNSCLTFPSIKDNQRAILFQFLKTKRIRIFFWKLMNRDKVPCQFLWHLI